LLTSDFATVFANEFAGIGHKQLFGKRRGGRINPAAREVTQFL